MEEAFDNAREAVLTHVEGLLMDDEIVPAPSSIDALRKIYPAAAYVWALVEVDLSSLSGASTRVNITLPENILGKIDAYAERAGESRSGFLAEAALEYIARRSPAS